jgi:Fe-S cluster assembly protein SufD
MQARSILKQTTFAAHVKAAREPLLAAYKCDAWERFHHTPGPRRDDERWRFSSLSGFDPAAYTPPPLPRPATNADIRARSNLVPDYAAKIVFANGNLLTLERTPEFDATGAFFGTIEDFARTHRRAFCDHFSEVGAPLGSERLLALHQAYLGNGCVLKLPDNATLQKPILIYNWSAGRGGALFPHTLLLAGANAHANIAEFYLEAPFDVAGSTSRASLAIPVSDLHAGPGANITRTLVQNWGKRTHSFQVDASHASRDATVTTVSLNLGSAYARLENQIHVAGPGANIRPLSLTIANGHQCFDQRTLQIHDAPGATSNLLFKNALLDTARTIFSGLIQVAPDAQKTDAYQTNRNLLLSPNAEAISLPGLQIAANDVKCSHGTTNSEVNPDELFYLRARGIPSDVARELLVFGFFEEVISQVGNDQIAGALRTLVREKLENR